MAATFPGTLLAIGDSITAADRSWAVLLAEELGLALERIAWDGATATALRPSVRRELAGGERSFAIGAVYVGVNDVRSPGWDADAYTEAFTEICMLVASCCERVVLLTAPLDLGRPPAGAKVADLNAIIREQAAALGAATVDLADVAGDDLLEADAVHLTGAGQRELARRASIALAA